MKAFDMHMALSAGVKKAIPRAKLDTLQYCRLAASRNELAYVTTTVVRSPHLRGGRLEWTIERTVQVPSPEEIFRHDRGYVLTPQQSTAAILVGDWGDQHLFLATDLQAVTDVRHKLRDAPEAPRRGQPITEALMAVLAFATGKTT